MDVTLGVEMVVALAISVLAVAWPVWRYWERGGIWAPKGSKQLPGSMGFPLLGETMEQLGHLNRGDVEGFALKRFRKYGDVFKSHMVGSPYAFFRGAEAAKLLITSEDKLVHAHQSLNLRKLTGEESMLNVHGPRHKLYRKLLNEAFMGERIRKYLPAVEQLALETLSSWKVGDVPVVRQESNKFTYHVIAGVVLGWGPGPVRDRSLELIETVASNFYGVPINFPGFALHKAMQARKKLDKCSTLNSR